MELEQNEILPFLDVLVKKKTDGTLSHTVCKKPTHTDLYLCVILSITQHKKGPFCPLASTAHELSVTRIASRRKWNT
jgi:hypothetical protein